tara:strand:- start:604 stop:825 length:222 start_codon:yes stop_codon:yes gene_type:complete
MSPTGKGKGKGNRYTGIPRSLKKRDITLIEAIILSTLLSVEPAFQIPGPEVKLERKRSHKRRRKIRKPIKGLR